MCRLDNQKQTKKKERTKEMKEERKNERKEGRTKEMAIVFEVKATLLACCSFGYKVIE